MKLTVLICIPSVTSTSAEEVSVKAVVDEVDEGAAVDVIGCSLDGLSSSIITRSQKKSFETLTKMRRFWSEDPFRIILLWIK